MAICPRCGAATKPGKTSCWNCWAPLTPEPAERKKVKPPVKATPSAEQATPAAVPPAQAMPEAPAPRPPDEKVIAGARSEEVASVLTPAPAEAAAPMPLPAEAAVPAPANVVEQAPPAARMEPKERKARKERPERPARKERPARNSAVTSEPAQPVTTDAPAAASGHRKTSVAARILGGAVIVLMLLIGSAALYWYFTFNNARRSGSPDEIGAIYLSALTTGNTTTQQFYATEESTGHLLPNWFTIINGSIEGKATVTGNTAQLPVVLNLNLTLPLGATPPALAAALQRPFHLPMVLRHEERGWQVDQLRLLQQLKQQILHIDPKLKLPSDD